jgi:hypothetical protein
MRRESQYIFGLSDDPALPGVDAGMCQCGEDQVVCRD